MDNPTIRMVFDIPFRNTTERRKFAADVMSFVARDLLDVTALIYPVTQQFYVLCYCHRFSYEISHFRKQWIHFYHSRFSRNVDLILYNINGGSCRPCEVVKNTDFDRITEQFTGGAFHIAFRYAMLPSCANQNSSAKHYGKHRVMKSQ
jgi:hypothetical protein